MLSGNYLIPNSVTSKHLTPSVYGGIKISFRARTNQVSKVFGKMKAASKFGG